MVAFQSVGWFLGYHDVWNLGYNGARFLGYLVFYSVNL